MGRRPKNHNPNIIVDRVGDKTDLSLCPICPYASLHSDCFSSIDGHCTALKKTEDADVCSFYKSQTQAAADAKRSYRRLKEMGRKDLINKYIKPLTAMGAFDDDIEMAEQYGAQFESFREQNYQEQFERTVETSLDDDLLIDDENEKEETDDGYDSRDSSGA